METLSALLAHCAGNSTVTGESPSHRPVTRSFDVFCDLRLSIQLSKQSRHRYLRRHLAHYDVIVMYILSDLITDITDKAQIIEQHHGDVYGN